MATRVGVLTEAERKLLQQMLDKQRQAYATSSNYGRHDVEIDTHQAPESYIAKSPIGGIPGPQTGATGTGSYSTDVPASTIPGQATCEIWQLATTRDGTEELVPTGLTETVFNLDCEITEGKWLLVTRDKKGFLWSAHAFDTCDDVLWYCMRPPGDSSGTGTGGDTGTGGPPPPPPPFPPCTSPITLDEKDVRCEDGLLNVYTRSISINIVGGCLTKTPGAWVLTGQEGSCAQQGTLTNIYYTNISNFTTYVDNTAYFNSYDNSIYINVNNVWYVFCPCDTTTTGTGTGIETPLWYCAEPPAVTTPSGTGLGTGLGTGTGQVGYGQNCQLCNGLTPDRVCFTMSGLRDPSPSVGCDCELLNVSWTLDLAGDCLWRLAFTDYTLCVEEFTLVWELTATGTGVPGYTHWHLELRRALGGLQCTYDTVTTDNCPFPLYLAFSSAPMDGDPGTICSNSSWPLLLTLDAC